MCFIVTPLLYHQEVLIKRLIGWLIAVFQRPERTHGMDNILPCHRVSFVLRSNLFSLHQVIEFLQICLKLGDKQIECHMLVHDRSLFDKEIGKSSADEKSHTVQRFESLFA